MKMMRLAALLAVAAMSMACTSYVRTYDAQNNLLGSCVAKRGWFFGGGVVCTGSANPKDQIQK